jgi:O-methyltransferase
MAGQTAVTDALLTYVDSLTPEPEVLRAVREETSRVPALDQMVSAPAQVGLLALLVNMLDARRILEVGTFTGYATLAMALAAHDECVITTCDNSARWTKVAKRHWERNGVAGKIDLRLGDAAETLVGLAEEATIFDLAYIDANKSSYPVYYTRCMDLVRPGGLILLDNTFCFGRVIDDAATDAETEAVRAVNELIRTDDRAADVTVLTIGDGMTIIRRNVSNSKERAQQ